jgi:YD repeat-containing protein
VASVRGGMRPPRCSALDEPVQLIDTEQEGKVSEYSYDPAGNRFLKKGPDGRLTLYLQRGQGEAMVMPGSLLFHTGIRVQDRRHWASRGYGTPDESGTF